MIIRKAKLSDVNTVAKMGVKLGKYHEKFDKKYLKLAPNVIKVYKTFFSKCIRSPNNLMLVAETKGKIIGYCRAEITSRPPVYSIKKVGYVGDLYLEPYYSRKGIGLMFVDEAHEWFRKKKLPYSELQVVDKNYKAKKAYNKAGYQPIMIRKQIKL